MLEPSARLLYLEELRPPEGYRLDRAIATTYTLDLLSLLMAPISMFLNESQSRDEILQEPMSALEAIRRTTGRIGIFCQKGHISVPKHQHLLYHFLEHIVVQVIPPTEGGAFHPKIWLLRFRTDDGPVIYRFLCLSRNLTFDKSWDTVLVLEGELKTRNRAFSRNHPLGDFIEALPSLAGNEIPENVLEHINIMSEEVRRVNFEIPYPFKDEGESGNLVFKPMGLERYKIGPKIESSRSMLIVSPFLSETWLEKEIKKSRETILISRSDSLNALNNKTYGMLESAGVKLFVMDEATEPPGEETDEIDKTFDSVDAEFNTIVGEDDLSGLHAKLFVSEYNSKHVQWWTGSANASKNAFSGVNIEFLVGLQGKASDIGIKKILGERTNTEESNKSKVSTLFGLLQHYTRPETPTHKNTIEKKLEDILNIARREICAAPIKLLASSDEKGTYILNLYSEKSWGLRPDIDGTCVPISLHKNDYQNIKPLFAGEKIRFRNLPAVRLTRFIAFTINARLDSQKMSTSFVLKLDCEGFPDDRDNQVIGNIINDSTSFLKYLLFLLSDNDPRSAEHKLLDIISGITKKEGHRTFVWVTPICCGHALMTWNAAGFLLG